MKKKLAVLVGLLVVMAAVTACVPAADAPPPAEDKPPNETGELFGFNPESLLLDKTYKTAKEACPDLVYTVNYQGAIYFYSEARNLDVAFGVYDLQYPDDTNENALVSLVAASAEVIFPDMRTRLSKSDVEAIIGKEVVVMDNDPIATEIEGEYIATFKYKGYGFIYPSEKANGDIESDTWFQVWDTNVNPERGIIEPNQDSMPK